MKSRKKINIKKKGNVLTKDKEIPLNDTLLPVISPPTYLPKRGISVTGITPEELLFAYEWADDPKNIKRALAAANIIGPRDSKNVIEKMEYEYTNNPRVLQAYQEALFNKLETLQITNNRIDSHLGVIAFTDRGLCKREDGNTIPIHEMPWEMRQCVQEFEEKMFYPPKGHPYKKTRVKFYSSVEAMRMLRKANDDDTERTRGMTNAMASSGGVVNISNYNNCGNQMYNGNIYNENSSKLDITELSEEELNILLKVMKKQIPDEVAKLEERVNEILNDEVIEADVLQVKEEISP